MWPFSLIEDLKRTINYTVDRIKDIEKMNEQLIGANRILEHELNNAQNREQELKDKLFDFAGINKPKQHLQSSSEQPQKPINLNRHQPWQQVKQKLEMDAREKYWREKQAESKNIQVDLDGSLRVDEHPNVFEGLEKEVFGAETNEAS